MENYTGGLIEAEPLKLPVGFRFHPTDEELISHYLVKKVADANFSAVDIGVIDMNRVEPWDLACMGKVGENEWHFFCARDRKYPTGLRTNRATAKGYWKATGKDTKIFRGKCLVGMKKTLVFYKGRAPRGQKTNWICKEFRLEGKSSANHIAQSCQDDWVIAKIYEKCGGKRELIPSDPHPPPPPMVDSPPSFVGSTISTTPVAAKPGSGDMDCSEMLNYSELLPNGAFPYGYSYGQLQPNYPYPGYNCVQEQGIYGSFQGDYELDIKIEEETMLSGPHPQGAGMITTDVNTEISSVLSNLEMGLNNYDLDQEGPSMFGEMEGSDDVWYY